MAAQATRLLAGLPGDRQLHRHGWTLGVYLLLLLMLGFTVVIHPSFGAYEVSSLAVGALPLALATVAQACVVLSGGIDLSVGAVMTVADVLAARAMFHHGLAYALVVGLLILAGGALVGSLHGLCAVVTRVPDIVVTLAMSFVWQGVALLILAKPGGGAPEGFLELATGTTVSAWVPNALILLIVLVGGVWLPLRSRRPGLAIYAVGSDRTTAVRSGVDVGRIKVLAYALDGFFSAAAGLTLVMSTGIGSPQAGTIYTLSGIAALVLGGISLAGGRGGMLGPIAAAFVLTLVPSDLIFLGTDPNLGQIIQGLLIVLVVMVGGLATLVRRRP